VDHLVTGSDYPVLRDYEEYKQTFAYIERCVSPSRCRHGPAPQGASAFGFND
jgi:hypothetical protein